MSESGDLDGRAALVTGAASGIGRAVAARLEHDGVNVLSVDLHPDPDGPGEPYEADLTSPAANEAAVAAALERFGRLDLIVPNAGIQHVSPVESFPQERWDTIIALLLTSPFVLARRGVAGAARAAVPGATSPSPPCTVSSPRRSRPPTCRPSTALLGLVKTLALEGAEDGHHRQRGVPRLRAHAAGREADRRAGRGARPARRSACWRM